MSNTEFPSDIDLTESEVENLNKGKQLKPSPKGTVYCFVVADATNKVSDNTASLMTEYTMHPLKKDGDPDSKDTSYKQKDWLVWPIENKGPVDPETGKRKVIINPKTGKPHEAPATGGLTASKLHALLGDSVVKSSPRKSKGSKSMLIDGQPVSNEAADLRQLEVNKQVVGELRKMTKEGPSHHVGMVFYAEVEISEENGNSQLKNFAPSCPPDKIVFTDF